MPTIDEAFLKVYSKQSGARATQAATSTVAPAVTQTNAPRAPIVAQRFDAGHAAPPAPLGRQSTQQQPAQQPVATADAGAQIVAAANLAAAPVRATAQASVKQANVRQPGSPQSAGQQAAVPHFNQVHVEVFGYDGSNRVDFPSVIADQGNPTAWAAIAGADAAADAVTANRARGGRPQVAAKPELFAVQPPVEQVIAQEPAVDNRRIHTGRAGVASPAGARGDVIYPSNQRGVPVATAQAVAQATAHAIASPMPPATGTAAKGASPTRETIQKSSRDAGPAWGSPGLRKDQPEGLRDHLGISKAAPAETAPEAEEAQRFQPVWEVDAFGWPETIDKLDAVAAQQLTESGRALRRASRDGLRVLAVTSPGRGQGRTTVAIQLARSAARSGLRVAIVDADTECPVLADRLCVEVSRGWIDAAGDGLPLEEVAVYSIADELTLLPLVPWNGGASKPRESTQLIHDALRQLARDHDLVVVDCSQIGSLGSLFHDQEHPVIDAAFLVCDQRQSNSEEISAGIARLQRLGIGHIGLVDNFVNTSHTATGV